MNILKTTLSGSAHDRRKKIRALRRSKSWAKMVDIKVVGRSVRKIINGKVIYAEDANKPRTHVTLLWK